MKAFDQSFVKEECLFVEKETCVGFNEMKSKRSVDNKKCVHNHKKKSSRFLKERYFAKAKPLFVFDSAFVFNRQITPELMLVEVRTAVLSPIRILDNQKNA